MALKRVGLTLLLVLVGLALVPIFQIVRYRQVDDETHLGEKRAYLESIERGRATNPGQLEARPNIVLVLLDDLGYGDLGSYGGKAIQTPQIDGLAAKGLRYTHYYAPSATCTPSRAGLLTGRYAPRAGLPVVVHPGDSQISQIHRLNGFNMRLPAEEIVLPEVLRSAGYRTGMIGKWHLGDHAPSLPNDFGFDAYFGALYSNDMEPFALYEDREVAFPAPVDQTKLNARYVARAQAFIEAATPEQPFFLYYAHNFPHVPLFASADQQGRSGAGLYGDVVEDVDRGIGQIVSALEKRGILDETLILVTSDNGPWFEGSPGASRGRKFQTWDGGARVPFIVHWPSRISVPRTIEAPVSGVDLFPTILSLLGIPLPEDRLIDGRDIGAGWTEIDWAGRKEPIYFFNAEQLDAVRDERFKYHRVRGVHAADFGDAISFRWPRGPFLFDYQVDEQEAYDVSLRQPEAARRMRTLYEEKVAEMSANPRGWIATAR